MQAANPPSIVQDQLINRTPLMWLSLAFLAGIVLASQISLSFWVWLLLAGVCFLAAIVLGILRSRLQISVSLSLLILIALACFALLLGATRYQLSVPKFDVNHISFYNDRDYDLLITGWLAEPPDYRDAYTNLRLQVNAVDTGDGDYPVRGLILARVDANQTYQYGQALRLRGKLQTPPENEDFSYRDYLAGQSIHSFMSSAAVTVLPGNRGNPIVAALYTIKQASLDDIYRIFPDPEASLLAGILLGVDTGLTRDLQQAFKNTGTAHIIAISGFNISIIAGLFITFFSRFLGQRRGAVAAVLGIALYTFIVGADAAVVRAAMMGSLALFARQVGRRQMALNTLLAVAAFMCLWNPLYIWDVGFQLSFFATLGLILYAEPFSSAAVKTIGRFSSPDLTERIAKPFSDFVLLTLAAQLTTLPIMAYHFKRISLVSFIANPFILPAQPAVMILGGLAVLLSWFWLPVGQLAAWMAWPFVVYTIRMVELFDRVPHGSIFLGNFSIGFVLLFYVALLAVTFGRSKLKEWVQTRKQEQIVIPAGGGLLVLTVILLLVWRAALATPDGRLHVTFLNVGSADSVFIQTPAGGIVLVNGGPSTSILSDELGRRLSFDRQLDWLVVAATEEDQVAALPRVLERYPPERVLWSGNEQASLSSRVLDEWLTLKKIPITRAESEQSLDLGKGATLRVLTTGPRGAVLLLEWQNFRTLLPIGMSFDVLDELQYGEKIGVVSVLSLADSGYAQSNPPDWIVNLNPELIVLSVAAGDRDGMPDAETLETIKDYTLLRTDENGWIEVATDGKQMWVDIEKK